MNGSNKTIYISGIGIISPLGYGADATEQALRQNKSAISPLNIFSIKHPPALPVGQIRDISDTSSLPRTHQLGITAAKQAMEGSRQTPDAVIVGTTTGGILSTEELLASGEKNPTKYSRHGLTTVAEEIAREVQCSGQSLTVSTACSSGTVAISMAIKMLQSGQAKRVLAGGADSLCRLTYFGFHSLQLVDPEGSKPFDVNRKGMSVAEGAALLLLTTEKPDHPLGQILGCGLSCDAHHPAAPHPEGKGAANAMQEALDNAKLTADDINYINLHGTGTPDNDLAESKAVQSIFHDLPPVSSIKGATGHGLAASGAIEAAIATICIRKGFLPANSGCTKPDPGCTISPLLQPQNKQITAVLSNSFGFGGNNGCLIISETDKFQPPAPLNRNGPLTILGKACVTGAGHTKESMAAFFRKESMAGILDLKAVSKNLPARKIRRLKRFSRIAMALAASAHEDSGLEHSPHSVFMGSGWGALSETYDFLDKLQKSDEQFPSPIDFVGSVHNSAAGQIAIMHNSTGANITSSGGDYSFEQALLAADSFLEKATETDNKRASAFVLAADEGHPKFSPLFDRSIEPGSPLADGGGGFYLCRKTMPGSISVQLCHYEKQTGTLPDNLIAKLGGRKALQKECGMILAGIPAVWSTTGEAYLTNFIKTTGLAVPVIHYRKLTGEFASASSVAAVMAAHLLETDKVGSDKKILVLGLGENVTAMEFARQ